MKAIIALLAGVLFMAAHPPVSVPVDEENCIDFSNLADVDSKIGGWSVWVKWSDYQSIWVDHPDRSWRSVPLSDLKLCRQGGDWHVKKK